MGFNSIRTSVDRGADTDYEYSHPTIEGTYPLAEKILKENAVKPEIFTDLYGEKGVADDLNKVEEYEKKFSPDAAKKTAEVFEAIMLTGELHNWFGGSAETIKTSRFDDIFNGTDMIIEFEEISRRFSHLGVAVDVTFGTTSLEKKFSRIKNEIDRGELAKIKYFYSQKEHFRGERSNIPRVIIGVEHTKVVELAALWLRKENKILANHPVQHLILEEMALQLEILKNYCKKTGKTDLSPLYEKDLIIIRDILKEKGGIKLSEELNNDKVFRGIRENLMQF